MAWSIAVLDATDEAAWPAGIDAGTRRYLACLATDGPDAFLRNGPGLTAELVRVGETVLPMVISEGRRGLCSILSPTAHHVLYPIEEIAKRSRWLGKAALTAACAPLLALFRAGRLDRAVFVNHWLLGCAPALESPAAGAWGDLIAFLAARHPDHAIIFQDVIPDFDPALVATLTDAGCEAVPTRIVLVVDPARPTSGKQFASERYNRNVGRRLLAEWSDRAVGPELAMADTGRISALYRASYIDRHSGLNPDYTEAFFRHMVEVDGVDLRGWLGQDGRLAAFNMQWKTGGRIIWSTFGREVRAGEDNPFYLVIAAWDLCVSLHENLLLCWGAGASEFKRQRGATPHRQDEMVFHRHLPWHRRLPWIVLRRLRLARAHRTPGPGGEEAADDRRIGGAGARDMDRPARHGGEK